MATELRKGVRVKVYQKPRTDEDFEGIAEVRGWTGMEDADDNGGWYYVRFPGSSELFERLIFPRNIVEDEKHGA